MQALRAAIRARRSPTRWHSEELCVRDLAWISGRAENLVSHHLRVLRAAGLVESRRDGKMVVYRVTEPGRLLLDAVRAETEVAR